ncbi:hypothetical protein C8J57DRAFT_1304471 [Mycena rebaudengoi]|nr:hypothetical protein C8J57DRAFT_1304471 [Mycena rebaudengoi]
MPNPEKGVAFDGKDHDPSHEAATTKLWTVYISEAEKYAKGFVASWRSDMDGMLIFAAFIIESYKKLSLNTGEAAVVLLAQISGQLAGNSSTLAAVPATPFVPPTTAHVSNALWFISLGLSLSSALITTLLEQWARDFLHKTQNLCANHLSAHILVFILRVKMLQHAHRCRGHSTKALSSNHSDTVIEEMVRCATKVSEQRSIRDQRALTESGLSSH